MHHYLSNATHTPFLRCLCGASHMTMVAQVVRVELPAAFEFKAGQYCELRIPAISESAWKPFTIASSPLDRKLTFYIKDAGNGGWTTQLCKMYQEIGSSPSFERTIQPSRFGRLLGWKATKEPFEIHVRGPYGAPAQCVDQFEHVVLVAGGIGATPMISAVRNLVMTEMQRESVDGLPERKGVYASNPECFAQDVMDMQHLLEPRFIVPMAIELVPPPYPVSPGFFVFFFLFPV
jgi:hypothetical protein